MLFLMRIDGTLETIQTRPANAAQSLTAEDRQEVLETLERRVQHLLVVDGHPGMLRVLGGLAGELPHRQLIENLAERRLRKCRR